MRILDPTIASLQATPAAAETVDAAKTTTVISWLGNEAIPRLMACVRKAAHPSILKAKYRLAFLGRGVVNKHSVMMPRATYIVTQWPLGSFHKVFTTVP